MIVKLLIYFFIFGFLGWYIDTTYRSIRLKKYSPRTFIPFFSNIYGISGVALVLLYKYFLIHPNAQVILGAIIVVVIEFLGGLFCVNVLKKRLWDYTDSRWNILGHIDLLHSFYWLLLAGILRAVFDYLPF